jgi:hypothetical protein
VKYIFHCFGHENIRARHGKTIEFSKDCELTARGDCIIGVRADFELAAVKKLAGKIKSGRWSSGKAVTTPAGRWGST